MNEKPRYASISPEDSKPKPLEFNTKEPWTGIWKVEASDNRAGGGIWGLKQRGKSVVSTRASSWEVKGKVKGDQLKGLFGGGSSRFVLIISSDGQSFEGKMYVSGLGYSGTVYVKGKRKQ